MILLNFSTGELIKVKLTEDELRTSEEFEDFSDFLSTIEDKYDFKVKDCLYMTVNVLSERSCNL